MSRSIAVLSIACAVAWAGCTGTSSRPRHDAGTTVMPGDDAATVTPGQDAGTTVLVDVGPVPDGGPADHDSDGIPDDAEASYGTDPNNPDTDGDGVTDGVEVLAHKSPTDPNDTIPPTDFYVVLPYQDPAQHRDLDFTARLGRGDVYFLIDTTGSMAAALNSVKNSLRDTIVPALQGAIADVVMGVGDYRDYDDGANDMLYGGPGDYTFRNRQSMTSDVMAVQSALNTLRIGGGDDGPESASEALYLASAGTCADGSGSGAACFRPSSHPIIVLVTDAPFHNGPDTANDYPGSFGLHTWSQTLSALNSTNVKVVGAAVGTGIGPLAFFESEDDERSLAMGTGSRTAAGDLPVYRAMGGRVNETVVNGVVDLVGAEVQDVSARSLDDTSDAVDATQFIKAITPLSASRPIAGQDATTFYGVPGGATVTFDVTFQNDFLPQTGHVQLFQAYIEVFDVASSAALDRRNVYIVVPALGGSILI